MLRWLKYNRYAKYILIAVGIVIAAVIATVLGTDHSKELNLYQGNSEVIKYTQPETTAEQDRPTDLEIVRPFPINMQIGIPVGWVQTIDGNVITYVHKESGSAIRMELSDYDPQINNTTDVQASSRIVSDGKTFVSFQRLSPCSYELYYSDAGVTTYDYMEEVFWDRQHILKITYICSDALYDRMQKTFVDSFTEFSWQYEDPITEGFAVFYDPGLLFEYGVPLDWYAASAGTYIYVQNEDASCSLSITPVNYDGTVEDLTTEEIYQLLDPNQAKQGMVLQEYAVGEGRGYVTSAFLNGEARFQERSLLLAENGLLLIETVTYLPGTLSEQFPDECFRLLRSFREGASEQALNPEPEAQTLSPMQESFQQAVNDLNSIDPGAETGSVQEVEETPEQPQDLAQESTEGN